MAWLYSRKKLSTRGALQSAGVGEMAKKVSPRASSGPGDSQ